MRNMRISIFLLGPEVESYCLFISLGSIFQSCVVRVKGLPSGRGLGTSVWRQRAPAGLGCGAFASTLRAAGGEAAAGFAPACGPIACPPRGPFSWTWAEWARGGLARLARAVSALCPEGLEAGALETEVGLKEEMEFFTKSKRESLLIFFFFFKKKWGKGWG